MRNLPSSGTRGKPWSAARRFRGWLATWAQDRRRERLLPAPVLVATWPSLATWAWTYANPERWNAYNSLDGGLTYQFDDWVVGSGRQYAPDGGQHLMFIVGVDANGREITHRSNAVRPDDAAAPVNLNTNLLAYWALDEAENEVRLDATPNGRDLAEADPFGNGSPTVYQTSGFIGNAATFDQSWGWSLMNYSLPQFVTGDFSLSFWFRWEWGWYDHQALLCVGATLILDLLNNDGAVLVSLRDQSGGDNYTQMQTPYDSVPEFAWTHCAVVKNGSAVRVYLNGVESVMGNVVGAVVPTGSGNFAANDFATGIEPWGYPLIGALDELAVWQRALSAAEVSELYNYGDGLAYDSF